MSTLKNLKGKKDAKGDSKKDQKKQKEVKAEVKKKQEEVEEDTNEPLVEIEQESKDTKANKNTKKKQANKLEEKEIDTSKIVIQKQEAPKPLTSWIVNSEDIDKTFKEKFDATKHDTDFASLTDHSLNKELQQKAKQEAEEKKNKVQEIGGFKYAALDNANTNIYANVNEPGLAIKKAPEKVNINIQPSIPIKPSGSIQFTNSKKMEYATIEKSAQQLRQEQAERKMQQNTTFKSSKATGWLGKKTEEKPQPQEVKVSYWASKGIEEAQNTAGKFAPIQVSTQSRRMEREQQEFKFTNKKEVEERRRKREMQEEAKKAK